MCLGFEPGRQDERRADKSTELWRHPILFCCKWSKIEKYLGVCGQSYKASMFVNYNSRVVSIINLLVITSLES